MLQHCDIQSETGLERERGVGGQCGDAQRELLAQAFLGAHALGQRPPCAKRRGQLEQAGVLGEAGNEFLRGRGEGHGRYFVMGSAQLRRILLAKI